MTHAQTARDITSKAAPGVFACAAAGAVLHNDFTTLERMLPGVKFAKRPTGVDRWELVGTCRDGSVVVWGVGA